jgi:hypothetical protein
MTILLSDVQGDMLNKTIARCIGASQPDVIMPDLEDRCVYSIHMHMRV